ncbi:MAG: hypothetical protein ISQ32_06095 [Rickettsiales bacterium]|nr:hypothetical protein [Rickettsiales bacterium]
MQQVKQYLSCEGIQSENLNVQKAVRYLNLIAVQTNPDDFRDSSLKIVDNYNNPKKDFTIIMAQLFVGHHTIEILKESIISCFSSEDPAVQNFVLEKFNQKISFYKLREENAEFIKANQDIYERLNSSLSSSSMVMEI